MLLMNSNVTHLFLLTTVSMQHKAPFFIYFYRLKQLIITMLLCTIIKILNNGLPFLPIPGEP